MSSKELYSSLEGYFLSKIKTNTCFVGENVVEKRQELL